MPRIFPPTAEEQRVYDLMVDETNHIQPFTEAELAELRKIQESATPNNTVRWFSSDRAQKIVDVLELAA